MERAIPILPADDLAVARDIYAAKLGFQVLYEVSDDGKTGIMGLARGVSTHRHAAQHRLPKMETRRVVQQGNLPDCPEHRRPSASGAWRDAIRSV